MYRSSAEGGTTWSPESEVSNYVPGYSYLTPTGYQFPYGDQFRMTIDSGGKIHMVWGEAPSYNAIGNSSQCTISLLTAWPQCIGPQTELSG